MLQIELEVKVKIVEECSGSLVMINFIVKVGSGEEKGRSEKISCALNLHLISVMDSL